MGKFADRISEAADGMQSPRFASSIGLIAVLFIVLGARLWLVSAYGSATPFWDQWGAEAASLYKPYLEGSLRWPDLFAAHNEHRIFFTRVIDLFLLKANGAWDPVLQMIVGAILYVMAAAVLYALLTPLLRPNERIVFSVLFAAVLAIPFGWENALWGFQSQFYLVLLFTYLAFYCFQGQQAFSAKWWLGIAISIASFFCMASGSLTPIAVAAWCGVQLASGARRGKTEVLGACMLCAISLLLIHYVPTVEHHAHLRASSLWSFLQALLTAGGWPLGPAGAIVLNAPVIVLAARLIRRRAPLQDPAWVCLGLAIWVGIQCIALAYGRTSAVRAPRYLDIYVLLAVINFAAVLTLLRGMKIWNSTSLAAAVAAAWMAIVVASLGVWAIHKVPAGVADRFAKSQIQTANLRAFIVTGDMANLANKPHMHIPFPSAQVLAELANDASIRSILPPTLMPDDANRPPERLRVLRRLSLRYGPLLLALGAALLMGLTALKLMPGDAAKGREA